MTAVPILIWCAIPEFVDRLSSHLGSGYQLITANDYEEVCRSLESCSPAALFVGAPELSQQGEDLMRASYRIRPDLPIVLVASTGTSRSFWLMQMYGLSAAFPQDLSSGAWHSRVFFDHVTGKLGPFALKNHFPAEAIVQRRIADLASRAETQEALLADFANSPHVQPHDLQLIFEEILNNAMFHAFRSHHVELRKTGERMDHPLEANEEVVVEWAIGPESSALAVNDNQGLLSPQDVWDRFFRQTSLTGLLDTDGRGLFLAHLLSRQVAVTISPGKKTQIAVFFSAGPAECEKLISIRVV